MIKTNTLEYYYWDDIQQFIADELGIPVEDFRDYHKHVPEGKNYKDWWHVWMTIVYDQVSNGGFYQVWFDMLLDKLQHDDTISEYGNWVLKLVPILEKLQVEVDDESMWVHYWW